MPCKEVTMTKLKKISIEPKYPDSRVYQLRMDWDNGRHQSITIHGPHPEDVAADLHRASLLIKDEVQLLYL